MHLEYSYTIVYTISYNAPRVKLFNSVHHFLVHLDYSYTIVYTISYSSPRVQLYNSVHHFLVQLQYSYTNVYNTSQYVQSTNYSCIPIQYTYSTKNKCILNPSTPLVHRQCSLSSKQYTWCIIFQCTHSQLYTRGIQLYNIIAYKFILHLENDTLVYTSIQYTKVNIISAQLYLVHLQYISVCLFIVHQSNYNQCIPIPSTPILHQCIPLYSTPK